MTTNHFGTTVCFVDLNNGKADPMNFYSPTIAVEKGVPLPPSQQVFKRKYPFNTMAVGDSFFVPGISRQQIAGPIRYATCECRKFTTRRTVEHGLPGLRVWRIL